MPVLADSGALYALADRDDQWHVRVKEFLEARRPLLLAPSSVLSEVCYLLRRRLGPKRERLFIESLAAGEVGVEDLSPKDLARSAELMGSYEFLGFVDASIVAVAERLKLSAILTTDRRDFGRVRARHVRTFELLP